LTVLCSIFN